LTTSAHSSRATSRPTSRTSKPVRGTIASAKAMLASLPDTRCLVSLSGKDSAAVLALAVEVFGAPNVQAFFKYVVPGLACTTRHIERWCRQLDVELTKLPHEALPKILKDGRHGPRPPGHERMRSMRQADVENVMRDRTGFSFVALGHRDTESLSRLAMLRPLPDGPGLDLGHRKVYPIWDWRTDQVMSYLKSRGMQAPVFDGYSRQGAPSDNPDDGVDMAWMQQHAPEDYARVLAVFPWVGAECMKSLAGRKSRG